jgi:hypothetical protein
MRSPVIFMRLRALSDYGAENGAAPAKIMTRFRLRNTYTQKSFYFFVQKILSLNMHELLRVRSVGWIS